MFALCLCGVFLLLSKQKQSPKVDPFENLLLERKNKLAEYLTLMNECANKIKNLSNSEKLNEIKKAYETEKIDYEMLKELLSTFKLT